MVRLVFRRLTHVRRTICTSVSLRASTRVSSGFTLARAKFTIFRVPSCMLRLDPILRKVGRCCGLAAWHHSLSLRTWVFHPNTRTEEHTAELQSLMRIAYAVFCLTKNNKQISMINTVYEDCIRTIIRSDQQS